MLPMIDVITKAAIPPSPIQSYEVDDKYIPPAFKPRPCTTAKHRGIMAESCLVQTRRATAEYNFYVTDLTYGTMAEQRENLLLAALPPDERERLDPFLEHIEMKLLDPLIEPNEPIQNMFFPFDSVTSTLQELNDGSTIETGLMGVEGMVGIQFWLGVPSTPTRTIIQVAGTGHRMSAKHFRREVMDHPSSKLNALVGRYTHAFLNMTSTVAACNRVHTIDQRMCRWLKLVHNRVRRDEFPIRQEFMAQMLGVQRPTLSTTAAMLQKAGLISYRRGNMKVEDPDGLLAGSCECLEIMESQFDRIFDKPWRKLASEEDRKPA